ncbi:MAG TPA: folylpolyglutamate synthase/dihydrofolate synthase family protein [Cyclobacteriaceae bacterium]|nr:folylpolyglutamate synthase/dihydrofolate synthase family protein [Cyclobacteriaceae bacterium]
MITDYKQVIEYLYKNLPMFQRVGASAFKKGLANTIELCNALNNPQDKFKSIHIAGTNGKGSTSHMIAAILQSSGYKTGLYTSPHLKEFTERIRVNGMEADKAYVTDFVNRIHPLIETIHPSFFEITVAMAFDYFARNNVEVAVIEVGLGGRLDSTNVIHPVLSLITNIGMDHTDILGDTLEMIAAEKAGIIKPNVPVVISERQPVVDLVFAKAADKQNTSIHFAMDYLKAEKEGDQFTIYKGQKVFVDNIEPDLKGDYQRKNILGVIAAIDVLRERGFQISDDAIRDGLRRVIALTGLKGRWQKLGDRPLIICDTGHNAEGIHELVRQIQQQRYKKLFFVMGVVKDKDISHVLNLLPKEAHYYFCQSKIPRALDARVLQEKAQAFGLNGNVIPDVNDAIAEAKKTASADDMIFIGGSTFVVAEIEGL